MLCRKQQVSRSLEIEEKRWEGGGLVVVWLSRSVAQFFSLKNIERNLFFNSIFFWWPLGCQGEPRPFLPHSSLFHTGHTGKKESSFSFFFFFFGSETFYYYFHKFFMMRSVFIFFFFLGCCVLSVCVCVCVTCWWDFFLF